MIIYVKSARKDLGFKKQYAWSQLSKVTEGENGLNGSFNKYLLKTCYLPETILGAEDTGQGARRLCHHDAYMVVEERVNEM